MRFQTILVPLDGTSHALAALPVAATLAEIEAGSLHILHVGERTLPPREMLKELGITPERLHGFVLDQAIGRPGEGVVRFAESQPDPAVVICTHTGMEKPRGALGSVAQEVLVHASFPVFLVQPERGLRPWALHRILLPHDGTPATAAAMDPAGGLAHRSGAEILVLHVAAPGAPRPVEPGTLTTPRYMDQPQHEWPAWAAEFLGRMTALGHPPAEVRFRLAMAAGEPGAEIERYALQHEVDLIVLAWHGRWQPERAATIKAVIRSTTCPVLVTRARPDTLDVEGNESR